MLPKSRYWNYYNMTAQNSTIAKHWSFIISGLSLVMLIVSTSLVKQQYYNRKAFDKQERHSKLAIRIKPDYLYTVSFDLNTPFNTGASFRQKFKCILSNTGLMAMSIVDWHIYSIEKVVEKGATKQGYAWYQGMNPIMLNDAGKPLSFPITINPKESKSLIVEVGMLVPEFAWNLVKQELPLKKNIAKQKVEEVFTNKGVPGFGQLELSEVTHSGNRTIAAYGRGDAYQEYLIQFEKVDGEVIEATFSLDSAGNMQGEVASEISE